MTKNANMFVYIPEHIHRAGYRFEPSQWETALLCNDVSHWLGANLESAPIQHDQDYFFRRTWRTSSSVRSWSSSWGRVRGWPTSLSMRRRSLPFCRSVHFIGQVLSFESSKAVGTQSFRLTNLQTFLTHCGLMTPYGDMELGQHWLR